MYVGIGACWKVLYLVSNTWFQRILILSDFFLFFSPFLPVFSHPFFAKLVKIYETIMAPRATAHLCVTEAVKTYLQEEFCIISNNISVLHNCSNSMFRPQSLHHNHEVLSRLHEHLCLACPRPLSWYRNLDLTRQTLFTEQSITDTNEYFPRPGRPALIITSTPFNPDEDLRELLFDALEDLDFEIAQQRLSLKVLVVVVTGKGPRRSNFIQDGSIFIPFNVQIKTLWLQPADYPSLLACADLGISLHTSTSGIDMPMTILDFFGCHVPVCARRFPSLPELVQDDVNGRIFDTSQELKEQLLHLLKPLATSSSSSTWPPHGFGDLARYSRSLQGRTRWDQNWNDHALPVIESAVAAARGL
jgi:beta-1,4-mannosyltransferase